MMISEETSSEDSRTALTQRMAGAGSHEVGSSGDVSSEDTVLELRPERRGPHQAAHFVPRSLL